MKHFLFIVAMIRNNRIINIIVGIIKLDKDNTLYSIAIVYTISMKRLLKKNNNTMYVSIQTKNKKKLRKTRTKQKYKYCVKLMIFSVQI